jgi:spore coat polysaccharide biosynthesis protein SpsF (cytidylyltransferase family)
MYTRDLTSKDTIDRHTHPVNLETPTNVIIINAKNVSIQPRIFKNIIKHIFQKNIDYNTNAIYATENHSAP